MIYIDGVSFMLRLYGEIKCGVAMDVIKVDGNKLALPNCGGDSLIERVELVRRGVGLTMVSFSTELGFPLQSYKGWRFGYRKLVPSKMLRSILNSKKLNCYFSFVLTGDKDGLPEQKKLPTKLAKTLEPFEGDRLHFIRKRLGLTRAQLVKVTEGLTAPTLKNYELMYRLRVPCRLYEGLAKHHELSRYVVFIAGGSSAILPYQKSPED